MQYRRDSGDMIETYKFTHCKYTSNYPFTNDADISRRGHSLKLKKLGLFHTNVRKHFFSERVINLWNVLPDQIVGAPPTITAFKNRLDQHWKKYQYSLDSIPTTLTTFIWDNQEESNETIVWQAQCLFKDVNIILHPIVQRTVKKQEHSVAITNGSCNMYTSI